MLTEDIFSSNIWFQQFLFAWILQAPGAPFVLVGSHADGDGDYSDKTEQVLRSVQAAEDKYCQAIQQELAVLK